MVNYSKFEAIVQAEVEESHETTQHVLTLLDLMILLPPREEFPVPSSRASTTRHPHWTGLHLSGSKWQQMQEISSSASECL